MKWTIASFVVCAFVNLEILPQTPPVTGLDILTVLAVDVILCAIIQLGGPALEKWVNRES